MKKILYWFLVLMISFSCAAYKQYTHKYKVIVTDETGAPLKDASIMYKMEKFVAGKEREIIADRTFSSNQSNIMQDSIDLKGSYSFSTFTFEVDKRGYEPGRFYKLNNIKSDYDTTIIIKMIPYPTHEYELVIVDITDNPIQGATVKYHLNETSSVEESYLSKNIEAITNSDGKINDSIISGGIPQFRYKVEKQGYYSNVGVLSLVSYSNSNFLKTIKIELLRPIDFFDSEFASELKWKSLRENTIQLIDLIKLKSLLVGTELAPQSIKILKFKNKDYLSFTFKSINVFNSIKMTDYQIGGRLFDEVVRNMLTPLNNNLSKPKQLFGYAISVEAHKKSFLDELAVPKKLDFDFLIPKSVVKSYKDNDISGQQLLGQSVLLLNDERIELKLQ